MKRIILTLLIFSIPLIPLFPHEKVQAGIGVGIDTSVDEELTGIKDTGHSLEGYEKSVLNQEKIIETKIWTPTDYVQEDIKGNYYTVQLGDTLWEIAEAYYGDAFSWQKIVDQNPGKVGTLPDGSLGLIEPGLLLSL